MCRGKENAPLRSPPRRTCTTVYLLDSLLQRVDSTLRHISTHTQRLNPNLGRLLESSNGPDVGSRSIAGTELASAGRGPAALGVVPWARVATGAGGEDGCFAGSNGSRRGVEGEGEFG